MNLRSNINENREQKTLRKFIVNSKYGNSNDFKKIIQTIIEIDFGDKLGLLNTKITGEFVEN